MGAAHALREHRPFRVARPPPASPIENRGPSAWTPSLEPGLRAADVERWAQSASIVHSNGDGLDIAVNGRRIVGVRGRAADRVNHGRLGPNDLFGWQAVNAENRLRRPLVRDGGRLIETDWDTVMGRIVDRSRDLLADPGGWGRFGFYTSGQLFLEVYYTLAVIGQPDEVEAARDRLHRLVVDWRRRAEAEQMVAAWRGRRDVDLLLEPLAATTAENAARSLRVVSALSGSKGSPSSARSAISSESRSSSARHSGATATTWAITTSCGHSPR